MSNKISRENDIKHPETSLLRRVRASFGNLSDWLNLFCLLIALGTAVFSVEQAQWVQPSPSFITIFILSVLTGFVLSKSRFPAPIAHIISIAIAIIVLFCQGLLLVAGDDLLSRVINFVSGIQDWWYSLINNIPASNTLHIALIFGFLTWIIGYFSIRPLIKKRNPWVAVLLGAATILLNLNFEKSDKYYYFLIFLIGGLALIAVAAYTKNNSQLARNIQNGFNWGNKLWIAVSICLIIIATSLTWVSPGFRVAAIADYSRANSPFKGTFQLFWQNFFATVPGSGSPVLIHGGQQDVQLGGPLELSDQVDYLIETDYLTYWKTQIYDYYDSGVWKTTANDDQVVNPGVNAIGLTPAPSGSQLSYTIIPQVNTDVIPTSGEFVSGNVAITEKTLAPMIFKIDFANPSSFVQLPDDIYSIATQLIAVNESGRRRDAWTWLQSKLPGDLELVSVNETKGFVRGVSIARRQPEIKDEIALTSAKIIEHQKTATVTVKIPPQVSPDELKSASSNYPLQITDRYLQLPNNLPGRIKELAKSIVNQSLTEYDKVQAIKGYLGDFQYNLKIEAPPEGEDGVDYFLFKQKAGYCTYFASAMTVMLRSVGIPARLVVGFLPGQYDPKIHSYIIRDRDYHAWTEVYFPGYGWITVDPTPSESGSADYSVYYVLPSNPNPSDQGSIPRISSPSASTPVNFGYYISLAAGVIAGIIFLLIIVFWFWIYSRPKSNSAMYSRMVLLASLAGLGPKRWQTALEFSNHLSVAFPQNAKGINRIVQTYVIDRYSDRAPAALSPDELEGSWPVIRNNIIKRWLHIEWLLE